MKKPNRTVKSILCCALLSIPAAHGAPRHFSGNSAAIVPPKAVVVHPTKEKIYVSIAGETATDKAKSAKTPKATVPKVVTPDIWHFSPKFVDEGKEDTTYGFMLKRKF